MKFVPNKVSRKLAMAALKTQKNSPTLLFGAGVVGVIGTVILSSRATLKVGEVIDRTTENLASVNLASEKGIDTYTEEDAQRDKIVIYAQAARDFTKLYGPAILLGAASIAMLAKSNNILAKRNAALTAAYAALDKSLSEYRKRVAHEIGEEREEKIWRPTEIVEVEDEAGKKVKVERHTGVGGSPYAICFDESNPNWKPMPHANQTFLSCQQQYANDLLASRGYVFLNEVYTLLGFKHTKAGQIVGWTYEGEGDGFIEFGIFNKSYQDGMRFATGEERSVWLDFNVDGTILDEIEKI